MERINGGVRWGGVKDSWKGFLWKEFTITILGGCIALLVMSLAISVFLAKYMLSDIEAD